MTNRKRTIELSLAERGRPVMWANEQEAASLCGVSPVTFRQRVKGWEMRGFPQINPENGKRPIPGILAFWRLPQGPILMVDRGAHQPVDDDDGVENFGPSTRVRRP